MDNGGRYCTAATANVSGAVGNLGKCPYKKEFAVVADNNIRKRKQALSYRDRLSPFKSGKPVGKLKHCEQKSSKRNTGYYTRKGMRGMIHTEKNVRFQRETDDGMPGVSPPSAHETHGRNSCNLRYRPAGRFHCW